MRPVLSDRINRYALPFCSSAIHASQAAEFTSTHPPHQSLQLALVDLIRGVQVSEESKGRISDAVGGATELAVVSVTCLVMQNRTQRMLPANEVEESGIACVACELDETTAFLVGAGKVESLIDQIAKRFDSKSLAAGVSMPVAGLEGVQSAYRQAAFARGSMDGAGIRYCRDLALPFLLGTLRKEPVVRDLLHPALGALQSYDRLSGSTLLETLRVYIACGCAQSEAAQKLFVHLNTLKYRIKRIVELTGIDFKDRDTLLYIELSFRLLD